MIMAMRSELRTLGRKVDAFERILGSTKEKVGNLAAQMMKAEGAHQKFRLEAREETAETNKAIENYKLTRRN